MASPFSGRAGRLAAIWQAMYLDQAQKAADKRIQKGQDKALASLGKGYDAARGEYEDAIGYYDPYRTTGLKAWDQYADASGVNGQEGYDRAVGNFRASPGYEWQVNQATDAVARKQSALGALGSGNTMVAIQDRANHLADQEYDDYLARLDNIARVGYDATGRQAGLRQGIGDLYAREGAGRAGIYQWGTGLGVNTAMNTAQGIGSAIHGGLMAGQNAAANRWNLGMQGLNLLAGALGRSNLFSGGGGGGTGQFEYPMAWG